MPDTTAIVSQLRTLEQLTRTENQVARIRVAQARTDGVRRELETNASNAERRIGRIRDALREMRAVPDVVGPVVGSLAALVKSAGEQAQRFDEALLGDLALERQLLDRARYLVALTTTDGPTTVNRLAEELVEAHTETVDWLSTVLAEEALGGPAALRATPLQVVRGGVTQVVRLPARVTADGLNRASDTIARAGTRARDRMQALAENADRLARDTREVLEVGFDAALDRAEAVTRREGADETAAALHETRRDRGLLTAGELPVSGYDALSSKDAVTAVRALESVEDVQAVARYEERHKNRSGVVTAARNRHAEMAKATVAS